MKAKRRGKPKPVMAWSDVRADGSLGNPYGNNLAFCWRGPRPPEMPNAVRVRIIPVSKGGRRARK